MLAISTSWMKEPEKGMKYWLTELKELGVHAVELSYRVDHQQLADFESLQKKMGFQVSSIHNFCPTPDDEPSPRHPSNYYRLSSQDEHERTQAVKWTKIAVDTAARVGASVVVIHAGVIDVEDERVPKLFDMFAAGESSTPEFKQERERILKARADQAKPYVQALEKSLETVVKYAKTQHVTIGLETRYYPLEMPNFDEIGYFLNRFPDGMGYWHDVGHAEINDRLGIKPHLDFLKAYQARLIGMHIHGIQGRRDHMAPFDGDMDLNKVKPFLNPKIIKVIESKPGASFELIKAAVKRLASF
jgi:sugar phosphate isomerase/epimerase